MRGDRRLLGLLGGAALDPAAPWHPLDLANTWVAFFDARESFAGVADDTVVSSWENLADAANPATQATGTKQPRVKDHAFAGKVVRGDGGDGLLTGALALGGTQAMNVFVVAGNLTAGAGGALASLSTNPTSNADAWEVLRTGGNLVQSFMNGNAGANTVNTGQTLTNDFKLISVAYDKAQTTANLENQPRLNGFKQTVGGSNNNTNGFGDHLLSLLSRNAASQFSTGDIALVAVTKRALTEAEIWQVEQWAAARWNLFYFPAATDFAASVAPVQKSTHFETSPFAWFEIETDATSATVEMYNNIYNTVLLRPASKIGVYVNGVYDQTISPASQGVTRHTITLPAGSAKRVRFINGSQTRPDGYGAEQKGGFVRLVEVSNAEMAASVKVAPPEVYGVVVGDSIGLGWNVADPVADAWPVRLRSAVEAAHPGSTLACYGGGYWKLHDLASDAGKRAATVALLAALNPARVWVEVMTNDYALSAWTAADFGTGYGAWLDALRAALPSVLIDLQSAIQRIAPANENANGLGSTLGNYRTQASGAASARSSYAVYREGAAGAIVANGELDTDGIHLQTTSGGNASYAAYVEAAWGV